MADILIDPDADLVMTATYNFLLNKGAVVPYFADGKPHFLLGADEAVPVWEADDSEPRRAVREELAGCDGRSRKTAPGRMRSGLHTGH